jgi:hypothetical protein
MAFVGNWTSRTLVPGGTAAQVQVPVPQVIDVSGNGFSGNQFSHYELVAMGATGTGANASLTASGGLVTAIPPGMTAITMQSSATTDIIVTFGKME